MKKRFGFVSNSSSSSFLCVVCNGMESGYDASLGDMEMVACSTCGNEFHRGCLPDGALDEFDAMVEKYNDMTYEEQREAELDDDIVSGYMPAKFCPVCSHKMLLAKDAMAFLKLHGEFDEAALLSRMKAEYPDFADFKKATKKAK